MSMPTVVRGEKLGGRGGRLEDGRRGRRKRISISIGVRGEEVKGREEEESWKIEEEEKKLRGSGGAL